MRANSSALHEAFRERLDQDVAATARMVRAGDELGDRGFGARGSLRSIAGQEAEGHAR